MTLLSPTPRIYSNMSHQTSALSDLDPMRTWATIAIVVGSMAALLVLCIFWRCGELNVVTPPRKDD